MWGPPFKQACLPKKAKWKPGINKPLAWEGNLFPENRKKKPLGTWKSRATEEGKLSVTP